MLYDHRAYRHLCADKIENNCKLTLNTYNWEFLSMNVGQLSFINKLLHISCNPCLNRIFSPMIVLENIYLLMHCCFTRQQFRSKILNKLRTED